MAFQTASRIATFALALAAGPVFAEATNVTPQSFVITYRAETTASPAAVYAAFGQVSRWWSSTHTYSGKAENLSLEMRAGGCWCEQWDAGSVQHMRVLFVQRDKVVRLEGGLGPLQDRAVTAVMTLAIAPSEGKTVVTLIYKVRAPDANLDKVAAPVDQVLGEAFKNLVELAGKPG